MRDLEKLFDEGPVNRRRRWDSFFIWEAITKSLHEVVDTLFFPTGSSLGEGRKRAVESFCPFRVRRTLGARSSGGRERRWQDRRLMDELAAGINEQARACAAPWRPLIVDIGVIVKDAVERLIDIGERIHPKVDRMR